MSRRHQAATAKKTNAPPVMTATTKIYGTKSPEKPVSPSLATCRDTVRIREVGGTVLERSLALRFKLATSEPQPLTQVKDGWPPLVEHDN